MNVYLNSEEKVVLEFDSQREIDALWLLVSHIGGGTDTLRSVFSNANAPSKGLYEQLKPYVTRLCVEKGIRHPLATPRSTSELLDHHHEVITGNIIFQRQVDDPSPAHDTSVSRFIRSGGGH
ncbi:hypothetical protein ACT3UJ_06775 [Halomonas sp. 86]|uniref:hypothetical protein n=1 Tax=unclassified Halomonas TaxID=2609666 RepID=UPI00403402AE